MPFRVPILIMIMAFTKPTAGGIPQHRVDLLQQTAIVRALENPPCQVPQQRHAFPTHPLATRTRTTIQLPLRINGFDSVSNLTLNQIWSPKKELA